MQKLRLEKTVNDAFEIRTLGHKMQGWYSQTNPLSNCGPTISSLKYYRLTSVLVQFGIECVPYESSILKKFGCDDFPSSFPIS